MNNAEISILISVSITVMLILAISLIIFFNYSQNKILTEKFINQQQKLDFQKNLLDSVILTQEKERARIAKDLHDEISSKLHVIHLNMHLLKKKVKDNDLEEVIENIETSLKSSIDRSRKISHELMPPILKKFGLEAALNDLVSEINRSRQIKAAIMGADQLNVTDHLKALHIFRIIQELTTNTIKHAHAEQISIYIATSDKSYSFTYSDDGIGIQNTSNISGAGMSNLSSRVQAMRGEWVFQNSDKGISISINIPKDND
jgi:signal transduction histidine kinase